jgi:hypothetical protein
MWHCGVDVGNSKERKKRVPWYISRMTPVFVPFVCPKHIQLGM